MWSCDYFDTWSAPKLLSVSERELWLMRVWSYILMQLQSAAQQILLSLCQATWDQQHENNLKLEFALEPLLKKRREKTHPVLIKHQRRALFWFGLSTEKQVKAHTCINIISNLNVWVFTPLCTVYGCTGPNNITKPYNIIHLIHLIWGKSE